MIKALNYSNGGNLIILRSCALTVLSRPVRFPLRARVPQPEKHGLSVCPDKIAPLVHLTPEAQLAGNAGGERGQQGARGACWGVFWFSSPCGGGH